ncbi:U exon [bat adenovirus 10]|uniref:U exon n=1 Tax=bat adenovirus 10 TaxID=3070193 RepID=A0A1X9RIW2_9ADEN|nr:U exon [Bat mastadenovirus WIV18]ARQ79793.1 U exon [bat adenovirus 10]
MILIYNGHMLKHKITFKNFRKFATKYNLNYQSFEEGNWVEIYGDKRVKEIQNHLR